MSKWLLQWKHDLKHTFEYPFNLKHTTKFKCDYSPK